MKEWILSYEKSSDLMKKASMGGCNGSFQIKWYAI